MSSRTFPSMRTVRPFASPGSRSLSVRLLLVGCVSVCSGHAGADHFGLADGHRYGTALHKLARLPPQRQPSLSRLLRSPSPPSQPSRPLPVRSATSLTVPAWTPNASRSFATAMSSAAVSLFFCALLLQATLSRCLALASLPLSVPGAAQLHDGHLQRYDDALHRGQEPTLQVLAIHNHCECLSDSLAVHLL